MGIRDVLDHKQTSSHAGPHSLHSHSRHRDLAAPQGPSAAHIVSELTAGTGAPADVLPTQDCGHSTRAALALHRRGGGAHMAEPQTEQLLGSAVAVLSVPHRQVGHTRAIHRLSSVHEQRFVNGSLPQYIMAL